MLAARRTFLATGLAGALAIGGVTAAIAADPAPDGPPAIAFLANGRVPADALAAGPIAGQLGAPIYTTERHTLSTEAAAALQAGDPELVIVLGGTVAIADTVVDQVEDATGLAETDAPTPDGGIIRAAGANRFATATAVADLLAAYDPAYLPVGNQAIDADTLDGKDSSEYALKSDLGAGGGDADTLDGKDSTAFALADRECGTGTVVRGIATDGTPVCVADAVDGGDADTLDGAHASDFQAAGNYLGANETAQNSIRLGGHPASEYMRTDGSRALGSTLRYSSPQQRTLFVGSRRFLASGHTPTYGGAGTRVGGQTVPVFAPISLPDGAVITGFRAFGYDDDGSTDLEVDLFKDNVGSNVSVTMAEVRTSGTPGAFDLSTSSISYATVDQDGAEYVVSAMPRGGTWSGYMGFEGALITYTVTREG